MTNNAITTSPRNKPLNELECQSFYLNKETEKRDFPQLRIPNLLERLINEDLWREDDSVVNEYFEEAETFRRTNKLSALIEKEQQIHERQKEKIRGLKIPNFKIEDFFYPEEIVNHMNSHKFLNKTEEEQYDFKQFMKNTFNCHALTLELNRSLNYINTLLNTPERVRFLRDVLPKKECMYELLNKRKFSQCLQFPTRGCWIIYREGNKIIHSGILIDEERFIVRSKLGSFPFIVEGYILDVPESYLGEKNIGKDLDCLIKERRIEFWKPLKPELIKQIIKVHLNYCGFREYL